MENVKLQRKHIKDMTNQEYYDQYVGLVNYVVKLIPNKKIIEHRTGFTIEDLRQIGLICLFDLKNRFDETKAKFTTYAVTSIKFYIMGEIVKHSSLIKFPREAKALHLKLLREGELEQDEKYLMDKYNEPLFRVQMAKTMKLNVVSSDFKYNEDETPLVDLHLTQENFDNEQCEKLILKDFLATLTKRDIKMYFDFFDSEKSQREIGKQFDVSHTIVYLTVKKIHLKASNFLKVSI